ncbi:MAG: hypothetical protein M5U28_26155 [Sandaracinaceae bacterium]|nr:hypothetical protein [Sandaracinaceae bacterium]
MATNIERTSRWVAIGALVASVIFFGWYGLAMGRTWPAVWPFFGGFALAFAAALAGVARRRFWAPGYTAGLSILTVALIAPAATRLEVFLFLGAQLALLASLGVRAMASRELGEALDESRSWRHGALAFTGGLAVPWLLAAGLLPGGGWAGLVGLAGALVAVDRHRRRVPRADLGPARDGGVGAALARHPAVLVGCITAPHDVAGEVASLTMGAGLLAWVAPIFAGMRKG